MTVPHPSIVPLHRHRPWILLYATMLQALWGGMLLVSDAPTRTTPIHGVVKFLGSRYIAGAVLLGASGLALWGLTRKPSVDSLLMMGPQQFLLLLGAIGALSAVVRGHYADGVERPLLFMLPDQLPAMLAAVLHSCALIEMHRVNSHHSPDTGGDVV